MHYPLKNMKILSGSKGNAFGMVRRRKDGSSKPHQGWDLAARVKTPIYAVSEGLIVGVRKQDNTSYGRSILLEFDFEGKTYFAFYAHIEMSLVKYHDWVFEGDLIGYSGETGNAKGSRSWEEHLHFELRDQEKVGKGLVGRLDPAILFGPPPYGGFANAGHIPGTSYEIEI